MFEKASRIKLRFNSNKGLLTVEDLWDLSLTDLNNVAKSLNRELKRSEEEDFLKETSTEDVKSKLAFDLVLHVLNTKKDEKEHRENLAKKREKKQRLMEILSRKQDEGLEKLSEEELLKQIEELS